MSADPTRTEGHEGHDRLTRIGGRLIDVLEADPEYRAGDRAIVMLNDEQNGGIALGGYSDYEFPDTSAVADMFVHLEAIFRANGKKLVIAPLGGEG